MFFNVLIAKIQRKTDELKTECLNDVLILLKIIEYTPVYFS